ncbi:unnamed protein product [Knipowitschia caucasica]
MGCCSFEGHAQSEN